MATLGFSLLSKTLVPEKLTTPIINPTTAAAATTRRPGYTFRCSSVRHSSWTRSHSNTTHTSRIPLVRASLDGNFSSRKSSSSSDEPRESIMLPGCDYNHWLIVMEFPKDPAPTREQMIDTYLNTLATVLGSMEEAKKNMYAFSTTTYTGFQCTVSEETSEKFKGLPGVLWVLPDSYIDVKNKDYGGDKYRNGEIIPCAYPTYQRRDSKPSNRPRSSSKRYVRPRDARPPPPPPPPPQTTAKQDPTPSESTS